MQYFTHNECMELLASIRASAPGDWTHDLNTICDGPARFVDRVVIPDGVEVVYFRQPDGADAWPGANWDRFAVPRAPQPPQKQTEYEQLSLF